MNIDELIKKEENSSLNENIKNKRILIFNTKLKKDEMLSNINNMINNFINDFNSSDLDFYLDSNLRHMLILFKGNILESSFCKKLNKEFTLDELKEIIKEKELNGEKLDYIKSNIYFYELLDNINEEYEDLKSILENTINIVLDNNINNLDKYLQNNILEEMTYNILKEFEEYLNNDNLSLDK